jgi:hypothetical protein
MAGRPPGSPNKDKPFRDALRLEAKALENGEMFEHPKGSPRWSAQRLLLRAGEDTQTYREAADRLDGKVPTPVGGAEELPDIKMIITGVPRAGD